MVFRSQDRYFYCKANFAAILSKLLEHIGNRVQNFFLLFLGHQILNSAFLRGSLLPAFLQNIENLNLWVFRSQDRYFYCKANFASFLSKLLEHIGNRMQNFFLLSLGRQILNSAFLKGSFLPAFLPNIENFNLG